jgi:hypothetical protein
MIRRLRARNSAAQSENKIHDDTVARTYGFDGGLVPGRDVYAYMAHMPVARWGLDWLGRGTIVATFRRPVYDGDLVEITDSTDGVIELRTSNGEVGAIATAALVDNPKPPIDTIPAIAGINPQPASPESLAVGTVLTPWVEQFTAEAGAEYLAQVDETLPLYTELDVAHPGWLLRHANLVLMNHVILGPWIHASSAVANFGIVRDGDVVVTKARVVEEFERRGHRYVVLDVLTTAHEAVVMQVEHTAIYQPRRTPPPRTDAD